MDILGAIKYPFKKEHLVSVLVIPGLLTIGSMIVVVVVSLLSLIPALAPIMGTLTASPAAVQSMPMDPGAMPMDPSMVPSVPPNFPDTLNPLPVEQPQVTVTPALPDNAGFIVLGGMLAAILLSLPFILPIYGYYWELLHRLQTQGLDAPAPTWKGYWKDYLKSGFQLFLVFIILYIPMVIASIPLGALLPFVIAPVFLAARDKTIKSVLGSFAQGFQMTRANLVNILGMFYLGLLLNLVYYVVGSITIIGSPFIMMAATVTLIHLMVQGYGLSSGSTAMEGADYNTSGELQLISSGASASQLSAFEAMASQIESLTPAQENAVPMPLSPQAGEEQPRIQVEKQAQNTANTKIRANYKGDNPWLRH